MYQLVKSKIYWLFSFCALLSLHADAQLKFPTYFGNGMVLQRDQVVKIWGWNAPKKEVTVFVGQKSYKATAAADSIWSVALPVMEAGGPYQIKVVSGEDRKVFSNVYFGDVWFCSGQSNMNFKMRMVKDHDEEVKDADYPQIRQLLVTQTTALSAQNNLKKAQWAVANAKTIDNFSAVSWFFAKELYKKNGVPIGIILSSWGGSPIETFMSAPALRDFPVAMKKIDSISPAYINKIRAKNNALIAAAPAGTKQPPGFVNVDNFYPTFVYNAMINPFFSYPVKGVLWYQGENNAALSSCYGYEAMLTSLINSWRQSWKSEHLPFLVVQLANHGKVVEQPESSGWSIVQEAQFKVSKQLKNVGLAVTNDIGEAADIHPKNKQDVGKRLAAQAFKIVYGEPERVAQGPTFKSLKTAKEKMEITFDHIGSGLAAKSDDQELAGFAVAGADNVFHRARALIKGNKVVVWSDAVAMPKNVRYAFEASPAVINFYNKEGFPAIPFRTDQLKDAKKSR